jgi:hypothetical protein
VVPASAGSAANQVPGNLAFHILPKQRLTRVGENSACKLHAILQKKFPTTQALLGTLIVFGNNL